MSICSLCRKYADDECKFVVTPVGMGCRVFIMMESYELLARVLFSYPDHDKGLVNLAIKEGTYNIVYRDSDNYWRIYSHWKW